MQVRTAELKHVQVFAGDGSHHTGAGNEETAVTGK